MRGSRRGRLVAASGLLLGLGYLAAVVATGRLVAGGRRPPFDGFTPTLPPYRWVKPPPELATGNKAPTALRVTVQLTPTGSKSAAPDVDDSQVILNMADGAIPIHPPDTSVRLEAAPVDPTTLPAVPKGLAADGNAYRVTMTYQPSGAPVTSLTTPGNVVLRYPTAANTVLYSPDGRTWQALKTFDFGAGSKQLGGDLTGPGVYLLAGRPASTPKSTPKKTSKGAVVAIIFTGGALLLVVIVGVVLRRRPGD